MEINGIDLTFNTKDPKGLVQRIMNFVNWSEGIIEQDEGDDFFFFKNLRSQRSWDLVGFDLENESTMIHFLIQENELTVVADKEMADLISLWAETISITTSQPEDKSL
jgi:hypothetical protein